MNISMEKAVLDAAASASAQKKLEAVRTVLLRVEQNPGKRNSRPTRAAIKKLLKSIAAEGLEKDAEPLFARLAVLSAAPRHRKPKAPAPIVEEVASVVTSEVAHESHTGDTPAPPGEMTGDMTGNMTSPIAEEVAS